MNTPLTPEDWIAQGYKKFTSNFKHHATFGLRKRFDDEVGKRYFINVWVYDNTTYMDGYESWSHWSFQPEVQLNGKNYLVHRVIWWLFNKNFKEKYVI